MELIRLEVIVEQNDVCAIRYGSAMPYANEIKFFFRFLPCRLAFSIQLTLQCESLRNYRLLIRHCLR
jgi:hypothetical protein